MRRICIMTCTVAIGLALIGASSTERADSAKDEEGFMPLFNEKDLTGWTGETAGYRFEDGILVADPGGNLYTEAEYADFILRFDFKLVPGANNGIGIRVPLGGKASREGMEIQILDDTAEKFAEAKPWQRHGSVYGIIPAKTGHLKPVGEWNKEEIRVQGTRVRVVLNDTVIVDADLAPFRDGAPTPDGKEHPGLKRKRGHISLAGHKTQLSFRNLRIKPLNPRAEDASETVPVVTGGVSGQPGQPSAVIVIPADAQPIAEYAADELVRHVEMATGVKLTIAKESAIPESPLHRVYLGNTRAAAEASIDVNALPSEAFVLRTVGGNIFIAAKDGPGDPLAMDNTFSGSLWGVYEVLERGLDVRWLWPGDLGTYVPKADVLALGPYDETISPRFVQRKLRPSIDPKNPPRGDLRLAFTEAERQTYAHEQTVFLRHHRMGTSAGTYFAERTSGSGHSFEGWWERYGQDHPEWFQLCPDGHRGPIDPSKPRRVSMCASNPGLHHKIVELWQEERERHPSEHVNIGIGENDRPGECCCPTCLAWDGPVPDFEVLPPGLERSYQPTQASSRYARFLKAVQSLATETDPDVYVHFYAFENYFWAPSPDIQLNKNVVVGFVPWFRWAGWFPRTTEEHEWIKRQWIGWKRSGASLYYRPNWFLDGWSMPHIYPHQFADAFQFYAKNGMIGTDFDSLMGQWAAQGPNLYLLARIHVRPDAPVDALLDEFYCAFGPGKDAVKEYFQYWEDYSTRNRENASGAIRARGGRFRRYAKYALVADQLYPLEAFVPAQKFLDSAKAAVGNGPDSEPARRVAFLQEGLNHAKICVATAISMNNPRADTLERSAAVNELIAYRRNVASLGIANLDRLSVIELESWGEIPGFAAQER